MPTPRCVTSLGGPKKPKLPGACLNGLWHGWQRAFTGPIDEPREWRVNGDPLKKPEEIHKSKGFTRRVKHSSFPFHCPGSLHRKRREKSRRLFTSLRRGQQDRNLETTNGFLTHMSWADGIHKRGRSGGKQWKDGGKYDGIRTLSGYKRRTSATQKNQPTSRARPSIVKQLEIYSSHPSPPPFVFLPPLGRKPAKPSFACSKPPSSIGKLISLSLKIAKPVKA
ncbi:hypothetical protein L3X38_019732 [Prunus dulcis]|uniref:Uncharacterized protein n=1 Tax=Prunus dulcis TaxID=3755 RepID=A0AAD4WBK6_PRUDU|nr:hypothetical protein L3X38_019732 [Prunus dulcis]